MIKTMRWIGLPLLLVLTPSLPTLAAGGYSNARDLQTDCLAALKFARKQATASEMYATGYCYGFLSGVADAMVLSEKIPAIENVPPDELVRVLLKYFDAHPGVLSLSAAMPVRMAFRQEYGKPQSPSQKPTESAKPEKRSQSPSIKQDCHDGNCAVSLDQKGGITAGQLNINAAEHLNLSDKGVDKIAQVPLGTCPSQAVSISLNNANDETGRFGAQLKVALEHVGMQVNLGSVVAFGANGPIPRGVVLDAGDNCLDLATSIATALASDKAVSSSRLEVSHVTAADWKDRLVITVSPPN